MCLKISLFYLSSLNESEYSLSPDGCQKMSYLFDRFSRCIMESLFNCLRKNISILNIRFEHQYHIILNQHTPKIIFHNRLLSKIVIQLYNYSYI